MFSSLLFLRARGWEILGGGKKKKGPVPFQTFPARRDVKGGGKRGGNGKKEKKDEGVLGLDFRRSADSGTEERGKKKGGKKKKKKKRGFFESRS